MTQAIKQKLSDSKAARWTALIIVSFTMMFGYFFTDVMSPLEPLLTAAKDADPLGLGWTSDEYGFFSGAYGYFNVFLLLLFFGGNDSFREPIVIEAEQFIAVKGFKAKGKRITTWQIENIELLPPSPDAYESLDSADASDSASSVSDASADSDSASAPSSAVPGSSASASPLPEENLDPDAGKSERQVRDEILGQLNLFPDYI